MKNKILSNALSSLKKIQDKEGSVFKSSKLKPIDITSLKEHNYISVIINGWYLIQDPATKEGDTTMWYVNAWLFFSKYLSDRFGKKGYCLNPHDSLMLHTQKNTIPKQITVIIKKGTSSAKVELLNDMSIFAYEDKNNFPAEMDTKRGVNVFTLEDSLCKSNNDAFVENQLEMEIALKSIRDISTINKSLISLSRMDTSAGRLSGAYDFLNRKEDAEAIRTMYKSIIGVNIKSFNPFEATKPLFSETKLLASPYASRVAESWSSYSEFISKKKLNIKSSEVDVSELLEELEEKYTMDAYHSLSIEGYKVTLELIDKIKNGNWNPEENDEDKKTRDTLAAKGYFEAFEELKNSIIELVNSGKNIKDSIPQLQSSLYGKLFLPSVQANILKASDLIGYRNSAIYLRGSLHVPPPKDALLDSMDSYFKSLENEKNIIAMAVLSHFIFGFIHPYIDGNGRISRFLMNSILVSNGLPWVIIEKEDRQVYMNSLEQASNFNNIEPFMDFIVEKIEKELERSAL